MSGSIRCARCGFVGFATTGHCKSCGAELVFPVVQSFEGAGRGSYAEGGGPRKGMAVASLVLGVVGLFTFGMLFVGALAGLALGVVALTRANKRPEEFGGRGLAIGGVVLNGISLVLIVPVAIVAAIAIPNLLAARRAANEAMAIRTMREVIQAEHAFGRPDGPGTTYPPIEELNYQHLVEHEIPGGVKSGYRFEVEPRDHYFVVRGTPVSYPNSGARSFYYSSMDSQLRAADKRGMTAGEDDPPLRESYAPGTRVYKGGPNGPDLMVEPRAKEDYAAESR
jgi:hypothetical protein